MTDRLFDAEAFAVRLRARAGELSLRQVAAQAGVSYSTVNRALGGWRDLSHENYLRLEAWLAGEQERTAA